MDWTVLPAVDAALNALATVLLVAGYVAIRNKRVTLHRNCMVSAFITSIVFLGCYLTYHTLRQMDEGVGHTRFAGPPGAAIAYYALLISHVVLAAAVPVLAILTLRHAFRGDFERHRRIARWTFPIWLYVSVTGVVIYIMLYHIWPPTAAA